MALPFHYQNQESFQFILLKIDENFWKLFKDDENEFIWALNEYTGRTWLGIANINGEYVAIDGSPMEYTNWDTTGGNKQPNNNTGDEYG